MTITLTRREAQDVVFWLKRYQLPNPDNLAKVISERLAQSEPERDFKFSTIEEARQPAPKPTGKPQLTDDELEFATAITTLIKAGYGKEALTLLKAKLNGSNA